MSGAYNTGDNLSLVVVICMFCTRQRSSCTAGARPSTGRQRQVLTVVQQQMCTIFGPHSVVHCTCPPGALVRCLPELGLSKRVRAAYDRAAQLHCNGVCFQMMGETVKALKGNSETPPLSQEVGGYQY